MNDHPEGGVGYLEMREYNKARWAYDLSHPTSAFMQWLREAGNVSFSAEDVRVESSSSPGIPIPATKLAHDEIQRISNELNKWADVEAAANDKFGASLLIDLGREVSTAMHRWPMEDKPRRIQELMCGECEQFTLVVRPPRFEGDHSIVNCPCGYSMTLEEFEQLVDMFKEEADANKRKALADARRSRRKSA
ncbi:hypothetical protein ACF07D_07340 [Leucobacter sp. NPDC015123]|uniref:hypothetical protein n=1 Tax=Leucobacter sp. NPDC015123 TaxID=3364129 RepID=UPI0036F452B1